MVSLSNQTSAKPAPIPPTNGVEEETAWGSDLRYAHISAKRGAKQGALRPPLPACGARVGVRGVSRHTKGSVFNRFQATDRHFGVGRPLIRRFAPPSPASGRREPWPQNRRRTPLASATPTKQTPATTSFYHFFSSATEIVATMLSRLVTKTSHICQPLAVVSRASKVAFRRRSMCRSPQSMTSSDDFGAPSSTRNWLRKTS